MRLVIKEFKCFSTDILKTDNKLAIHRPVSVGVLLIHEPCSAVLGNLADVYPWMHGLQTEAKYCQMLLFTNRIIREWKYL